MNNSTNTTIPLDDNNIIILLREEEFNGPQHYTGGGVSIFVRYDGDCSRNLTTEEYRVNRNEIIRALDAIMTAPSPDMAATA